MVWWLGGIVLLAKGLERVPKCLKGGKLLLKQASYEAYDVLNLLAWNTDIKEPCHI